MTGKHQMNIQYRLRGGTDLYDSDKGVTLLCAATGKTLHLKGQAAEIAKALQADWLTVDDILARADSASHGYYTLVLMQKTGMLDARITQREKTLFSVSPAPQDTAFNGQIEAATPYRLNRYAYLHQTGGELLLESPLSPCRVSIHDGRLAGMLHQLCSDLRLDLAGDDSRIFLSALIAMGMAEPARKEEAHDPLAFWQFHDLLHYARTLHGRTVYPLGATYHLRDKHPTLPAVREPISDDTITLPTPSAESLALLSTPFSEVLGKRASRREYSDQPMTKEELGAFLHIAAKIARTSNDPDHEDEVSKRPSPSGGARHALEIYPLVRQCLGIAPGAYRYDALNHRLERVPTKPEQLEWLLEENPHEMMGEIPPQVTLNIAARIGRTAWKYESIAYKLINQDMGCLYQTFYLAATALGLAPCALGSVNTDHLGKAHGIDWREEPFIGAFTLGK